MNKRVAVIISPNYKDYAKKYLAECFLSIKKQDYADEMKVFITDNESTEESFEYVKKILEIPLTPFNKGGNYEIIRNKDNDGFAKGNNDAIKKALEQGFDYIALFNMDTVLGSDCVKKMVEAAEIQPPLPPSCPNDARQNDSVGLAVGQVSGGWKIGAVQARLMLYKKNLTPTSPYKGEGIINSLGNVTHFLGFGYAKGYGEEYKSPQPPLLKGVEICYPSGAAVLFKREVLEKVGLFDEEFWMYNEDQDIGWRIWLSGLKCVLAPEAVVYHKYEFSRSIKKYYWMDRNRILSILKNYHLATLVLIFPAFLVMEIGLIFFAVSGGWFKEKINVYKYFLSLKNWRYIIKTRRQTQKLRLVKDKDIIKLFSGKIWYQEIGDARLKIANIVFGTYWRIARVLIRW